MSRDMLQQIKIVKSDAHFSASFFSLSVVFSTIGTIWTSFTHHKRREVKRLKQVIVVPKGGGGGYINNE